MNKKIVITILLLISTIGLTGCFNKKTTQEPIINSPTTIDQQQINNADSATKQVTQEAANSYTLDDVTKHSSATDCWMAVNGKVYNVTDYVPNHPAGDKILKGCGKDASGMFAAAHAEKPNAADKLPEFFIGNLK